MINNIEALRPYLYNTIFTFRLLVIRNKKRKVKLWERHLIVRSGRKHMLGLVQ